MTAQAQLRLTGFLESFDGEHRLLLQVQWKDLRLTSPPTLMASSLLLIPYRSRLPPSRLDLEYSLLIADFSPDATRYLDLKIAIFLLDLASAFPGGSTPSFFILAEIETQEHGDFHGRFSPEYQTPPLMPRRMDPVRQPRGVQLRSRLFNNNVMVVDSTGVRGTEEEDSPEKNRAGASLHAITKLRVQKLEKEVSEIGECSVCLQRMTAIKEVLATSCDHVFHTKCVLAWLKTNKTCPLCRSKLHN